MCCRLRPGARTGGRTRACAAAAGDAPGKVHREVGTGRYRLPVSPVRRCSRSACGRPAVATLTYVYSDSTAVLGPLATYAEPHCYDLCVAHSERLTAPRGWEVLRLAPDPDAGARSSDDLEALADAVREAARPDPAGVPAGPAGSRRGHLRVLPTPDA
jgi:hypothetical protein